MLMTKSKAVDIVVGLIILIVAIPSILIVLSVDIGGMRIERGVAFSKIMIDTLCEYKK